MAYYDQGYNVVKGSYRPDMGGALLGGMKAGSDLQTAQLGRQAAQQTMEQGALLGEQKQEDRQTQQMGAHAAQVTDQPSYDRFRNWMTSQGETEAGFLEDGLTPQYTPDVASILKGNVGVAQGVPELGKPAANYTLGNQRRSGTTNKILAEAPFKPSAADKIKPSFAKNFNERLSMDIGEDLSELPKEDVKLIRDTTSAKMRKGADFEQAYTSALQELGLQENEGWGFNDYKLAPQTAPQEQVPTGQSINQPDAREQELRAALEKNIATRKEKGYK